MKISKLLDLPADFYRSLKNALMDVLKQRLYFYGSKKIANIEETALFLWKRGSESVIFM